VWKGTAGSVTFPEQVREHYRTVGGTPHLDGQYTVFGHVVSGLEIVEKIQSTATDERDRPIEDVRIISVKEIK
jgi:peptidyl-prolyl cis-trans isomerase B (cyclophilin B)